ncbi:hypothetical protein IQ265_04685 [Nodosilinea sp. LEGE 06152]|uniref:hypothetical protein n=1 Tax=Nodosilinea sp. LEGE 06152 TaxID=2777966 RepID=UPI00187DEF0A|nr:hypothetical protein [Nodosilinea sp. LEGE 06152]MBE9156131.1 hypothetical protein [Nodosilinea sp. LEGE 06152]
MPSLRTILLIDSTVCFAYGAILTVAADSLAHVLMNNAVSLLGYSPQEALRVLGLCVLGIGLYVCGVACTRQIVPIAVWLVIGIEVFWIVGSLLLLAWIRDALSWIGVTLIVSGAIAVCSFMVFELIGLQALLRSRFEMSQ